jgi:hypothetical protein
MCVALLWWHCCIAVVTELITVNFQEKSHGELLFAYVKRCKQPDKPLMVMEFWSGWFDHWGDKHQLWPVQGEYACTACGCTCTVCRYVCMDSGYPDLVIGWYDFCMGCGYICAE